MKQFIRILTVIAILTSVNACKKLLDIVINTVITENIQIHINQTSGNAKNFNGSITINLDNEDTQDYLDKIEDITIKKLTYKIINFYGDSNGTVEADFFIDNDLMLHNNLIVKSAADEGTVFEIDNIDDLNTIAQSLKNNKEITASYSGNALCNSDAMDFTIEVTLDVDITANPL